MKQIILLLAVAMIISYTAIAQNNYAYSKTSANKTGVQSTSRLEPQIELQIKNIVENEAYSFYCGNFSEWKKNWLQDDSCLMGSIANQELTTEIKGWKLIEAAYQNLESNPELVGINFYEHNYNKISDNVVDAESSFRIITVDPGGPFVQQRMVLKKVNGEWKIVALYNCEFVLPN
jgi:hypothetical protein